MVAFRRKLWSGGAGFRSLSDSSESLLCWRPLSPRTFFCRRFFCRLCSSAGGRGLSSAVQGVPLFLTRRTMEVELSGELRCETCASLENKACIEVFIPKSSRQFEAQPAPRY